MKKRPFSIKLLVLSIFLMFAFSMTSCGWKPSEEEINALEETRAAALDAEKSYQEKKAEADDLQRQVDQKKAELERVKAEQEKVNAAVDARQTEESE